jgi:hypothetical protein
MSDGLPKLWLNSSVELIGMNREEDRPLWDLLGRSKGPTPSPFFARNVVRAVRVETSEKHGLMAWFNLRRLVPAFSGAAIVAIAVFTFQVLQPRHRSPHRGLTSAEVQDSEVAADLDLLASNDDDDDSSLL